MIEKGKSLLHALFKTAFSPDGSYSQNKHIPAGSCEVKILLEGEQINDLLQGKITSFRQKKKIQDTEMKAIYIMLRNHISNITKRSEIQPLPSRQKR